MSTADQFQVIGVSASLLGALAGAVAAPKDSAARPVCILFVFILGFALFHVASRTENANAAPVRQEAAPPPSLPQPNPENAPSNGSYQPSTPENSTNELLSRQLAAQQERINTVEREEKLLEDSQKTLRADAEARDAMRRHVRDVLLQGVWTCTDGNRFVFGPSSAPNVGLLNYEVLDDKIVSVALYNGSHYDFKFWEPGDSLSGKGLVPMIRVINAQVDYTCLLWGN